MDNKVSSLGQGPGLAWKRGSSSFPPGSLAELQDWTGGKTEPPEPPWHGEVDFQQWNTIGWGITDEGILCIRPWNGSAGETGEVTNYTGTPWYDQRSKIRKIESTGTIALNENSLYLFYGCSSLTDLTALANWDVSNITNMYYMFYGCSSLRDLRGLEDWNVSSVESMGSMFFGCSRLTDLDAIRDWDVSEVTNMSSMFYRCSSLTDLTALKDWRVSHVENMNSMFYGCSSLTDLRGLERWNVSSVTSMNGMFYGCSSLCDLRGLEDLEVSNVTSMSGMFYGCSDLTDLTALQNWNVSSVTNMNSMFHGCSSLQRIGIPSITNGGQKLAANAEDAKLTTVLPSIISEDGSMGPLTWDELYTEMTTNQDAFLEGTVWLKAEETAQ